MTPAEFRLHHPDMFYLEPGELGPLDAFLRKGGVLDALERIQTAACAGEGNMNCTVRVTTSRRTLIVKQARPWVEKYPQFAAPWDRACREAEFYQLTAGQARVAAMMPRLIYFEAGARLLVLEDLGPAKDYTGVYRGEVFTSEELLSLGGYLSALHGAFGGDAAERTLTNREMRALNHAHIFVIPLAENNGLELDQITPGLAAVAGPLKADAAFRESVSRLGRDVYLADGRCLLHGDFFPGSFMRTAAGPRVIDPEFGFFGQPELDVAVLLAHLLLAHQPPHLQSAFRQDYMMPAGFEEELMLKLVGVEIMRRLIGYAQLPIGYGLDRKRELLELARDMVLNPHPQLLQLSSHSS